MYLKQKNLYYVYTNGIEKYNSRAYVLCSRYIIHVQLGFLIKTVNIIQPHTNSSGHLRSVFISCIMYYMVVDLYI